MGEPPPFVKAGGFSSSEKRKCPLNQVVKKYFCLSASPKFLAVSTARNFGEAQRQKYFPTAWSRGHILFAAEENPAAFTRGEGTPNISGTALRQSLDACDLDAFKAGMPKGVDSEKIFNTLCPAMKTNENVLRQYITAIIAG